jgi:hypothetical protein
METMFNCIGLTPKGGFYFAEFEKTSESLTAKVIKDTKGQLIIGQKTITIKLNKEDKDYYTVGSSYVFELFNNTKK